jgi:RNA-binding protein YhbY
MSSRGISATQVSEVLNQLKQEGYIKIRLGGNEIDEATSNGAELYMVNQGGNNGV